MINMHKKIFVLLSFLVISYINASPIVDIENVRQSGKLEHLKIFEFSLNSSRGNEDRDDFDLGIALVNNSSAIEKLLVFERSERTQDEIIEDEATFTC